jgi:hypothetical protein
LQEERLDAIQEAIARMQQKDESICQVRMTKVLRLKLNEKEALHEKIERKKALSMRNMIIGKCIINML